MYSCKNHVMSFISHKCAPTHTLKCNMIGNQSLNSDV